MVDASYDPERIAEQHEFGGCAEKIAKLETEIARMKPIVEAVQTWQHSMRSEFSDHSLTLVVDEYEKSLK